MPIEIETERLRLCHWREGHFEAYAAYYADEEMARWVGGLKDHDEAWRHMASLICHWSLRGYGYWALEERESGRFVGCAGLWFSPGWPELELGYWLVREAQGKGYATEAAARCRDYAFEVLGVDTLVSYIRSENEPSRRVAERLGARCESPIELMSHGPHLVYRYQRRA